MTPAARRASVALVFSSMWAAPFALPFRALGVSSVAHVGGASWAPHALPFREGSHSADPGWYVALALGVAWPLVLTWAVVEDLSALQSKRRWGAALTATLAMVGTTIAGASWILWPSLCFFCSHWETPSPIVKVHHIALVEGGAAIAIPAWASVLARIRARSVGRAPLHRWVALVALCLFVAPPYLLLAKSSELILFAIASWTMWVRELPRVEEASPWGRWPARAAALALASATAIAALVIAARLRSTTTGDALLPALHLGVAVASAGVGLAFVAICMTVADALAWVLRRARSVRARMLVLGLACAALAFALTGMYVPIDVVGEGETTTSLVLTLVAKLVCVGIMVAVLSAALSRGLARSLERSVQAMAEIRQGNLDVALDDSGRDEVAAVARSFNELVSRLRQTEFLERLNVDLRARSMQLAQTLDALRTAQADLVRSERMASVAALVKGIAHELNNPINYIAGNIEPLQRYCAFLSRAATELSDGRARTESELAALTRLTVRKDLGFVSDDLARLTVDIGEGARRAQLIISDLQSLTSAAQRGVETIDLHRVVRQTIALLRPGVPAGVHLEADLAPVPPLSAMAGQIEQVLVNLADNALRAVGDDGEVRISVERVDGDALVKVTDDGAGMSEEVKRQAFEPFFTTRAAGEGSGLGLAIVASIVRAHRGTVTLTSEPGKGTEVELRLPLHAELVDDRAVSG
jgi:signal transduction histidine kinase